MTRHPELFSRYLLDILRFVKPISFLFQRRIARACFLQPRNRDGPVFLDLVEMRLLHAKRISKPDEPKRYDNGKNTRRPSAALSVHSASPRFPVSYNLPLSKEYDFIILIFHATCKKKTLPEANCRNYFSEN